MQSTLSCVSADIPLHSIPPAKFPVSYTDAQHKYVQNRRKERILYMSVHSTGLYILVLEAFRNKHATYILLYINFDGACTCTCVYLG